tara:strand:+ start:108 stop:446 length:339 start_codon:yes stop_codon:yes gene_type:complete
MAAGTYNFTLEQGSTFSRQITVQENSSALNLTGYTARMQMRSTHDSSSIALTFTTTIASPASNGIINLTATASNSSAVEEGMYVYDLEIESSGGVVTRLMEGTVTVTPEVTR